MRRLLRPRDPRLHHCTYPLIVPLIFVLIIFTATTGHAQTTTWTGAGITDNWSEALNWNNGAPQNGYVVHMNGGGASYLDIPGLNLFFLDMSGWVGMLYMQQNLTVNGPAYLFGNVQMQGRHISANFMTLTGNIDTGGGSLTTMGGSLGIYGHLSGNGNLMISGNIQGYSGGSILGAFDITMSGGGDVDLNDLSTVDLSGGSISMSGGTLALPPGATVGDVNMAGSGTISTGGGTAYITGNLGVASLGTLNIEPASFEVTGVVNVGSGATLFNDNMAEQTYGFNGGVVIDSGTFRITAAGCELSFGAGTTVDVNGTGTFEITGGSPPDRIILRQDGVSGGTQWTLDHDVSTTINISWANIQDGIASPAVLVSNCADLGNNLGFIFERDIEVAPMALNFGPVPVTSTTTDTLVVYNRGGESLSVTDITSALSQYTASPTSFTVAGYDSQYVLVGFTPDGPSFYIDSLMIVNNDPDENPVVVSLSGNGAAADLTILTFTSPTEAAVEGEEVTVSFTIANTGDLSSGPFRASLRISADSVITTGDVLIDTAYVANIDNGSDTTIALTAPVPKPSPRGNVYLGVIADDLDQVVELDEDNNTTFNPFTYHVPSINYVRDVPSDQGGAVFMSWYRSPLDDIVENGLITEYSLWRSIDDGAAAALLEAGAQLFDPGAEAPEAATPLIRIEQIAGQTYFWQLIASHPAYLLEAYGYPMPTLFDSTGAGFEYHYFQVIAHTSDRLVFYTAAPDSGYSVDNLAPAAPQNVAAEQSEPQALLVTWDANTEADLSHYAIYRGTDAGFTPDEQNRVAEPADPSFEDGQWRWDSGYYYKITALDIHGNESPVATSGPEVVVGAEETGPPRVNYLGHSRPNPFGVDTRIDYGLSQSANVSIKIYDVAGRLVRTLVDGRRGPDHYSVHWNGRDDAGRRVAGGVYFYRIMAGDFTQTKKATLLR